MIVLHLACLVHTRCQVIEHLMDSDVHVLAICFFQDTQPKVMVGLGGQEQYRDSLMSNTQCNLSMRL